MSRTPHKEETKTKKLQRKYEEAKKEIKRLRNIIKRINPEKLNDVVKDPRQEYRYSKEEKPQREACPKCHGYKVKVMEFTRRDGKYKITFCQAEHCQHRSPMTKVEETESNSEQE